MSNGGNISHLQWKTLRKAIPIMKKLLRASHLTDYTVQRATAQPPCALIKSEMMYMLSLLATFLV